MAADSKVARFFRENSWAFPAMIALILLVVGFLIWNAMKPAQGSWRYGLCRSFIQFEFAYPISFDVLAVAEDQLSSRIYFAEQNPFGNERIIQADCDYQVTDKGTALTRLSIDRKPVSKEHIALYNRMIPILMTQDMDLDLPPPMPRTLDQLKR